MKKYFMLAAAVAAAIVIIRAQETTGLPMEAEATMRAAASQKNPALLDKAAAGYAGLHQYDVARQLLDKALSIRVEAEGTGSASYAEGLVKLGDLAVQQRQFDQAETYYAQAIALGDRREIAPALFYMGIKAYRARDYQAAQGFLERIVATDPQGAKAGPALMWLGNIKQHDPDGTAQAEMLYQRALGVENPKSLDAVDTMRNYATLLKHMGRFEEAAAMDQRSRAGEIDPVDHQNRPNMLPNGVYRVGPGVTPPALLQKSEPQYTEEARAGKIQGTTLLMVEIGADGYAHNATVSRSLEPALDQKAIEAVSQWLFRPGAKDGVPVTVAATIEVNWRLQ
jgi:TonB family protein